MSVLLVIGAGGHGSVVADAALSSGRWQSVAFVDDRESGHQVVGFPVVGGREALPALLTRFPEAIVAIGNAVVRLALLDRLAELGFKVATIIHPSSAISRFATVGPGSVVMAQAAINARAVLARGCIVNTGATVDHDCELAEGVHVCPGVHLAGNVYVGARSWIGIGACVKQGIRIHSDVTVGAGAAVINDIEAGVTVVGVPARVRQRT